MEKVAKCWVKNQKGGRWGRLGRPKKENDAGKTTLAPLDEKVKNGKIQSIPMAFSFQISKKNRFLPGSNRFTPSKVMSYLTSSRIIVYIKRIDLR